MRTMETRGGALRRAKPTKNWGVSSLGDEGTSKKKEEASPYKDLLLRTLDRIGCGGLVINAEEGLVGINGVALEILRRRTETPTEDPASWLPRGVEQLLRSAASQATLGDDNWLTAWQESEHPLAMFRIPMPETPDDVVLVLVDIDIRLQPNPQTLRRMFGLTTAETKLAAGIALGFTPVELATQLGVRRTTVRSHLASVFSKTQTKRQAELVALLARMAILP